MKNNNNNFLIWEITKKCNYNCSYCPINKNCYPTQNYKDVIKKFKKLKGKWNIGISGGEPFYAKNFKEIVKDIINETDHDISFSTNLSASIKEINQIINIAKKRLKHVIFSLHLEYVKPEEFLKKSLRIRESLKKYNCCLVINCVAVKEDLEERERIGKLFRKYNFKFVLLPRCICFKNVDYYSKKEKKIISRFGQNYGLFPVNFKNKLCFTGKNYFIINSEGDAYRCHSEMDSEPWKASIGKNKIKEFNLYTKPKKCPYSSCICESPYYRGLIKIDSKKRKVSWSSNYFNLKTFFIYLIHTPERLLGKFGIFLRKYNPNLYHKLKKIEKKIRR